MPRASALVIGSLLLLPFVTPAAGVATTALASTQAFVGCDTSATALVVTNALDPSPDPSYQVCGSIEGTCNLAYSAKVAQRLFYVDFVLIGYVYADTAADVSTHISCHGTWTGNVVAFGGIGPRVVTADFGQQETETTGCSYVGPTGGCQTPTASGKWTAEVVEPGKIGFWDKGACFKVNVVNGLDVPPAIRQLFDPGDSVGSSQVCNTKITINTVDDEGVATLSSELLQRLPPPP
jgi:hypothetical protein